MAQFPTITPTLVGVFLLYAVAPLVLIYDLIILAFGKQTISEWVWMTPERRISACIYLTFVVVILILHLGFKVFPG